MECCIEEKLKTIVLTRDRITDLDKGRTYSQELEARQQGRPRIGQHQRGVLEAPADQRAKGVLANPPQRQFGNDGDKRRCSARLSGEVAQIPPPTAEPPPQTGRDGLT